MTRIQSLTTIVCLGLVGCSSVTAGRQSLIEKPKTIVYSGDTPVALRDADRATIENGLDDPDPPSRPDGRISGRVLDQRGRAVPNAEVRLADGGMRSGRDQSVLTDATGAFTLRNLRPGGTYTLIAEGSEGQGGRAEDRSPGTPVTIRLGQEDQPKAATADSRNSPSRRVGRVSQRDLPDDREQDDGDSQADRSQPKRINADDLPPVEEAESVVTSAHSRPAWRKGATSDPAVATVEADASQPPRAVPIKPAEAIPEPSPPKPPAEEGPNPLPPAKERPEPEPQPESKPAPAAGQPIPSNEPPPSEKSAPANPATSPAGDNPAPNPSATTNEPPANPFATDKMPAAGDPEPDPSLRAEAEPRKKGATWGQLAAAESSTRKAVIPTANLSVRRMTEVPADSPPAAPSSRTGLIDRLAAGRSKDSEARLAASCQFDARKNRLVDFRLPDLDGNPLRWKDFDSDFVLIEFWGTWSEPSKKSIPHLVELQERYGAKALRVIGVADVRSPNFEQESRTVRDAAQELGINYQLLLSEADGKPCPLQDALNIQHYPTLVLVDRSGQVLWREVGNEATTMSRLDRVIAARADGGIVRR